MTSPLRSVSIPFAPSYPTDGRFIITPERAQEWLDRYNKERPRPFSEANCAKVVGALKRKEWSYNGSAIVFSMTMKLLNGQHRLTAVTRTGIAIDTAVLVGVADEASSTIDRHKSRSNSDYLASMGEKNTNVLASVLGWLWRWENDGFFKQVPPSPNQLEDVLNRHPGIRESCAATHAIKIRSFTGQSIPAFVHYVAGISDSARRDEFFKGLSSGANLDEKDPVLVLRQRLQANSKAKARLPPVEILALYIKAWNAFKARRPVGTLRWRQVGPTPEPFPVFE